MIRRALLILACAGWTPLAAKPELEHLYPTAAAPGSSNTIALTGKFDPWPPKIWSSVPLEFEFPTNKGTVHLKVPENTSPGACLVRVYNDEGASDPCIFLVSAKPHLPESEPNDHFAKPQAITNLPVTINGRLDKRGDVDSFGISMTAGQWLDARVDSYTLMSKVDAVLRLVTREGYQIAWNHDFGTFDPRLVWRAPEDQEVVLQIFGFAYPADAQIQLTGGNGAVYQLHLAASERPPADLTPENTEREEAELPLEMIGSICPAGDEDRVRVRLQKDQTIEAAVEAAEFGSVLDPWLQIENKDGKQLARNDDAPGSPDAQLEWKAPEDGEYAFVVGSVIHSGAEDWLYRLTVREALPDFAATVAANAFVLDANATNEVTVKIARLRDFTNELTLVFAGLPEAVTAEEIKTTGNEAKLLLIGREAAAFNGPVQIVVVDKSTEDRRNVNFELISRSENNGVPGGYSKLLIERTDQLWLTVKPGPPKEEAKP